MERIELISLFIILDLTHFIAWEDLPLVLKHKCFLPAGSNLVVVCNLTDAMGSLSFNGVYWVGVDVAWSL